MAPKAPAARILAVDDDPSVCRMVERVLGETGYAVSVAMDGPTALTTVELEKRFDLYVIDMVMPPMNGDTLARHLRRLQPDARILYFTGHSDLLFQRKSRLWEHEAFLEKPVTMQGLLEATSLLLYGHKDGPRRTRFSTRLLARV